MFVSVLFPIYNNKKFLWCGLRKALIYGHSDVSLRVILFLCSFSRIIVIRVSSRPMTYLISEEQTKAIFNFLWKTHTHIHTHMVYIHIHKYIYVNIYEHIWNIHTHAYIYRFTRILRDFLSLKRYFKFWIFKQYWNWQAVATFEVVVVLTAFYIVIWTGAIRGQGVDCSYLNDNGVS